MAKIELSIVIDRPVEEVFAFKVNVENDLNWASDATEIKKTSEGPIGVGTTFHRVGVLLGRRSESEIEITEYDPYRKYTSKSKSGPFPFEAQWTFESVPGGTQVSLAGEAELDGLLKLAEPVIVNTARQQFQSDLEKLKKFMEARAV